MKHFFTHFEDGTRMYRIMVLAPGSIFPALKYWNSIGWSEKCIELALKLYFPVFSCAHDAWGLHHMVDYVYL